MKKLTIEVSNADHARIAKIATLLETTPEKYARWQLISDIGAMEAHDTVLQFWHDVEGRTTDKPSHSGANKLVADLTEMFAGKTLKKVAQEEAKQEAAARREFDQINRGQLVEEAITDKLTVPAHIVRIGAADTPRFLVTGEELKQLGNDLAGLIYGEISTTCKSMSPAEVLAAWRIRRKVFVRKREGTAWDVADLDRLAGMLERILPMLAEADGTATPQAGPEVERFSFDVSGEIGRLIRFVSVEREVAPGAFAAGAAVQMAYASMEGGWEDDERDAECAKAEKMNTPAQLAGA